MELLLFVEVRRFPSERNLCLAREVDLSVLKRTLKSPHPFLVKVLENEKGGFDFAPNFQCCFVFAPVFH